MPMTPKRSFACSNRTVSCSSAPAALIANTTNPTTGKTTIVPFHAKDLKPGTEKNILKLAGLKK